MAVSSERHAPPPFTPGTLRREAGYGAEPVWTQRLAENPLASAGDRTPIARSVVIHYTV
jgi:hypothetical protein